MACSQAGMIRIWKTKPESRMAGSSEVIRPTWKAKVCVSAIVEMKRPKARAPVR